MFKIVKEIRDTKGQLRFTRRHIFSTPWFHCYIHRILHQDDDFHLHNHPWTFLGIILWGGYEERTPKGGSRNRRIGSIGYGGLGYYHKVAKIFGPTTSLFFTGVKRYDWGYMTSEGFIQNERYRELKHKNQLPK